jgi:hypothetical protein
VIGFIISTWNTNNPTLTQRSLLMMMEKSRKGLRQKGQLGGILTMPIPLPSHENPKVGQDFSVVFNPSPPNPPFNLFAPRTSASCDIA